MKRNTLTTIVLAGLTGIAGLLSVQFGEAQSYGHGDPHSRPGYNQNQPQHCFSSFEEWYGDEYRRYTGRCYVTFRYGRMRIWLQYQVCDVNSSGGTFRHHSIRCEGPHEYESRPYRPNRQSHGGYNRPGGYPGERPGSRPGDDRRDERRDELRKRRDRG